MNDKIVVTNRTALTAKYGPKGFTAVRAAVAALVARDKTRDIKTAVVYLDDATQMKKLGAKPLARVSDYRGAKAAIDGVFKALKPDWLMILGASDVVPHQDLDNPAFKAGDDDDEQAWGDLPYACDVGYGRDPAKFVGPTRVVTRLPDLMAANEPSHLVKLLKTATNWKGRQPADYAKYFGLSASVWKGSTELSLDNIFGNTTALMLAPPSGPKYPGSVLGARMHFINCHGGDTDPNFYGQKGKKYPVSLTSKTTAGAISEGAVAAIECCYGAQLYDSATLNLDLPICQSYLRQGAYGYLGSTTIAYGPAEGNGSADLICQYFLRNILDGASVGRAALMARQQFVEKCAQMDPMDLKTLAQFCIYGDPSIHPVIKKPDPKAPKSIDAFVMARFGRSERRAKLKQTGEFLLQTKPTASKPEKGSRMTAHAKATLAGLAAKGGLPRKQPFVAFAIKGATKAKPGRGKLASTPTRYYLTIRKTKSPGATRDLRVAVVAKELGGRIVDYCIYYER
jgi:hypothetical protein